MFAPPPLSPKMSVSPLKISVPTPVGENCFSPFPVKNVAPPLCVLRGTNISYTQEGEGKHLSHSGGHIYIEGRESLYVGIVGGDDGPQTCDAYNF